MCAFIYVYALPNIYYSDEPLQLGEMYCIEISGRTDITDWSGALRLGVTTEVTNSLVIYCHS